METAKKLTPEAICQIIDSGTGLGISYCVDLIMIFQLDDGQFVVARETSSVPQIDSSLDFELEFDDPLEAAKCFLEKRVELECGDDFECE